MSATAKLALATLAQWAFVAGHPSAIFNAKRPPFSLCHELCLRPKNTSVRYFLSKHPAMNNYHLPRRRIQRFFLIAKISKREHLGSIHFLWRYFNIHSSARQIKNLFKPKGRGLYVMTIGRKLTHSFFAKSERP